MRRSWREWSNNTPTSKASITSFTNVPKKTSRSKMRLLQSFRGRRPSSPPEWMAMKTSVWTLWWKASTITLPNKPSRSKLWSHSQVSSLPVWTATKTSVWTSSWRVSTIILHRMMSELPKKLPANSSLRAWMAMRTWDSTLLWRVSIIISHKKIWKNPRSPSTWSSSLLAWTAMRTWDLILWCLVFTTISSKSALRHLYQNQSKNRSSNFSQTKSTRMPNWLRLIWNSSSRTTIQSHQHHQSQCHHSHLLRKSSKKRGRSWSSMRRALHSRLKTTKTKLLKDKLTRKKRRSCPKWDGRRSLYPSMQKDSSPHSTDIETPLTKQKVDEELDQK